MPRETSTPVLASQPRPPGPSSSRPTSSSSLVEQRAGGRDVAVAEPHLDQLEEGEHLDVGAGVRRPGGQLLEGGLGPVAVTELARRDRLGDVELGAERPHLGVLGEAPDTGGDPQRVERVSGQCETHRACRFMREPGAGVRGDGRPACSTRRLRCRSSARRGPPRGPPGSSRTARWGRPAPRRRAARGRRGRGRCRPASRRRARRTPSAGCPGTTCVLGRSRFGDRVLRRREGVEEAGPVDEQAAPGELHQRGGIRTRDLGRDPFDDPVDRVGAGDVEAAHRDRRQQAERLSRLAGVQPVLDRRHVRRPCSPATGPRGRAARAVARASAARARRAAPRAPGCAPRTTRRSRSR